MHRPGDRSEPNKTDLRTQTLTLTVSLFIAMLAFFMVLNSYASDSKEKQHRVRSSITSAFGLIGDGRAMQANTLDGTGTAGEMETAASTSLRSVLPDLGFQSRAQPGGGSIMSVTVSRSDMDDRWLALRSRLGELLVNDNPGGRYKLQIIALDGPAHADDLASLAASLEEDGVDVKLLSIGYEDRGKEAVELRFIGSGG